MPKFQLEINSEDLKQLFESVAPNLIEHIKDIVDIKCLYRVHTDYLPRIGESLLYPETNILQPQIIRDVHVHLRLKVIDILHNPAMVESSYFEGRKFGKRNKNEAETIVYVTPYWG